MATDRARNHRRSLSLVAVLFVLLPLLTACMGDDDEGPRANEMQAAASATVTETADPTPTATELAPTATATPIQISQPTATSATAAPNPTGAPQPTPVGEPAVAGDRPVDLQLNWLLSAMNGEPQTGDEVESHLHPAFIDQVPVADFASLLDQLEAAGPWEFEGYLGEPIALDGYAVIDGPSTDLQVIMGLEVESPHRFLTLIFLPYTAPSLQLDDLEEVDAIVADSASLASFQVAEITDETCSPIHGVNPEQSLAIASAFKLWVLLELAEQVAAGALSWDDQLAISADLVSLPSGTLQVEEPGLEIDLRTYAAKMIALSDNTATDHLIHLLGREKVEARFAATGHSTPERNMPLLLTRELFYLKLAASEDELADYVAADSAGRRVILDAMTVDLELADPNRLAIPTAIDSVEWFASAADLCGVMAALHRAGENDPVVREILAASSGAAVNPNLWPFVGYKGGNEAGVASGVWLLERSDGRIFTISAIMNDPNAVIDASQIPILASAAADLLVGFD